MELSSQSCVLVAEASAVVRGLLSHRLEVEAGLEVFVAGSGRQAIRRCVESRLDAAVVDISLGSEGEPVWRSIQRRFPSLPLIVFGDAEVGSRPDSPSEVFAWHPIEVGDLRGHAELEQLSRAVLRDVQALLGADASGDARLPKEEGAQAKVALAERSVAGDHSRSPVAALVPDCESKVAHPYYEGAFDVVVVGASTGGPRALERVLGGLPSGLHVPVVVVQHMPKSFTGILARSLDSKCGLAVAEMSSTTPVFARPGEVWIAGGGHHLELVPGAAGLSMVLNDGPQVHSCRPAVDPLFCSAARAVGPRALGVLLTGMGQDGASGCGAIRRAGGRVIVQDEATSAVWGMPGAAAKAGHVDAILPLDEIGFSVLQALQAGRQS